MNRHPHVRTLIAFDGEPEPEPPDRPRRPWAVGLVAGVVVVAAIVLAPTLAVGGQPLPSSLVTPAARPTLEQCALGFACSPSAEVAAREALENAFRHAAPHACGPGSGGYRTFESSSAGLECVRAAVID